MARALMIQGTGSNVGKSMLVAGLCRAAKRRGLNVRPFKPQNMSNNAAVTADGGEIGRAQAVQALAAGVETSVHMNPVLLKPETETGAQVVVQGKAMVQSEARAYRHMKPQLMEAVLDSFGRLKAQSDLVIVEGAGSPAEINLRAGDIANMGFARAADVPVVLAGDINRGGVIAQIVGTKSVIEAKDAALIEGFLVNAFRGDPSLFDDGYLEIERRTGWRGFGVLPWFEDAWRLPAEDAMDLTKATSDGAFKIVCLGLNRIANFDDLDPLAQEPDISLQILQAGQALPGDTDLVIIPGSKSTLGDLGFLRAQGWDIDLQAHVRRGGNVLGICGGYQMLGTKVCDPEGLEGPAGVIDGLGLLDIETLMTPTKALTQPLARHAATGLSFNAYEIHIGTSDGPDHSRPFAYIDDKPEGAMSADGRITGSYLHGMFADDEFRKAWLAGFGVEGQGSYRADVDATLNRLADHMETHVDVDGILSVAR
ncbi:MAG: cobyric acid synthase [Dinoroseobacter sp.]|nr:cobyric acid synthase [Dinoroseobacter sp.]